MTVAAAYWLRYVRGTSGIADTSLQGMNDLDCSRPMPVLHPFTDEFILNRNCFGNTVHLLLFLTTVTVFVSESPETETF